MYTRNVAFVAITVLVSACNTVNIPIENAENVTVNNPTNVQTPEPTSTAGINKKSNHSFKYLSKLTLAKGPCPDRDPSTYGLLLKQRTTIVDGNIVCFYN